MYKDYDFVIVGAGIVGPALATGLAKQGRSVLVVERDLSEPDRIVGELLQPGGVEALKKLGMASALEGIDAVTMRGYQVILEGKQVNIPYPKFAPEFELDKSTVYGELATGRGFHHGRFVMALRRIAQNTPGVEMMQGTVTDIIKNKDTNNVLGVHVKHADGNYMSYFGKATIVCDGTNSKFRKDFNARKPVVQSYFVGAMLKNPTLVRPNHGHVIISSKHKPILVYQTSSTDARILCDVPAPLPSLANGDLKRHLELTVLPNLPEQIRPSFREALDNDRLRSMPNQYLPASRVNVTGLILLGDAMNMRHPLTGGGMTVGLTDAVKLSELLGNRGVDLTNWSDEVMPRLNQFYSERKSSSAVVNVLSVALYSLFSSASAELGILQRGCFHYFRLGGRCVTEPVSLLSGLLAKPSVLFINFFAVAFLAIYDNFLDKGILGFPMALIQVFTVLFTAVVVFVPYFIQELL